MAENDAITVMSNESDDQGYCTRFEDGVSGMTVTVLAEFCGTVKSAITQLLNQISYSDPFTNELAECLKPFAGVDWRLFTNEAQKSAFIIDEVCHAVLEYYALEAREYKGKQVAVNNYRMIAKAGMRVFLWSQTGYSPVSTASELVMSEEKLSVIVTAAVERALIPANQLLERIEQRLNVLLPAKPKHPWTLPSDTPQEQVPQDYMQIEDGSWLSPEAYESILRQSQRSLLWELREIKKRKGFE
jgi:hypothetical protein